MEFQNWHDFEDHFDIDQYIAECTSLKEFDEEGVQALLDLRSKIDKAIKEHPGAELLRFSILNEDGPSIDKAFPKPVFMKNFYAYETNWNTAYIHVYYMVGQKTDVIDMNRRRLYKLVDIETGKEYLAAHKMDGGSPMSFAVDIWRKPCLYKETTNDNQC